MSSVHKIIKYCAIAFAIFLIVNIIVGLFASFKTLYGYFTDQSYTQDLSNVYTFGEEVDSFNFKIGGAEVKFIDSTDLKIETNMSKISFEQKDNMLNIVDERKSFIKVNKNSVINIYLDLTKKYNDIKIETGAGSLDLSEVNSENMSVQMGAGKITVLNSYVNNFELELGAGEAKLEDVDFDECKIENGFGDVTLKLKSSQDIYKFDVSKGLSDFRLNNIKITENYKSDGQKNIKVTNGVGNINITTN